VHVETSEGRERAGPVEQVEVAQSESLGDWLAYFDQSLIFDLASIVLVGQLDETKPSSSVDFHKHFARLRRNDHSL